MATIFDPNSLLAHVGSNRGAPMGRPTIAENPEATVLLFRVRFVDGDYDAGGAYWGGGKNVDPIYAAIGDGFQTFVRAPNLEAARVQILESHPDLTIQTSPVNDDFLAAYIEAALWSSNDDEDVPIDSNYGPDDLSPELLAEMTEDCRLFLEQHGHLITAENCRTGNYLSQAGHDFWLNRNGHGCGFWDGDWQDEVGEKLSEACEAFGESNLYVNDGKIYSL